MQCWKNIDDYWNADGDRELSDTWTGFTRFILLNERPLDGYTWSGRRLTSKQTTSRPDNEWPGMWKHMSDAAKRREKQKSAVEKPKLDNARKLRGIYFIDHQMNNSRILKKRRKFEVPLPAAMPAEPDVKSTGRRVALWIIGRQNTHASLKPTNPRESVWKELFIKVMSIILWKKESIH